MLPLWDQHAVALSPPGLFYTTWSVSEHLLQVPFLVSEHTAVNKIEKQGKPLPT